MSKNRLEKDRLLKKFKTLTSTAICIQKTSKLLLQNYKYADAIVVVWYQSLCTATSDQNKIALFYIANEILQSKMHGTGNFKKSWKPQLVQAVDKIKDAPFIDRIKRILTIWIERKVYEQSFVEDLIRRLCTIGSPKGTDDNSKTIVQNFDCDEIIEKLKNLIKIENQVTETMKVVDINSVNNFDEVSAKTSISQLKDKSQCYEFAKKLDDSISQLFQLSSMLEEELKERQNSLKLMENAEIFYETQFSETLIVEDAYRRYGNLISKTRVALEKHVEYLMDDDDVNIDVEDAPSPGKTPPHLYDETINDTINDNQMAVSPSQSMDMSDDENSNQDEKYSKPYSPSHQMETDYSTCVNTSVFNSPPKTSNSSINSTPTHNNQPNTTSETKTSLSNSDALKLLTSVFSQSLTKKPNILNDSDSNKTLIGTITSSANQQNISTNTNNNNATNDVLKLISTLTGLNNITERSNSSIPTIMSFNNTNQTNTITTSSNPTLNLINPLTGQLSSQFLQNSLLSIQNNPPPPPPPPPTLQNPLFMNNALNFATNNPQIQRQQQQQQININSLYPMLTQSHKQNIIKKTPGSCTDDDDDDMDEDGGDTPTQDEPSNNIIVQNNNNTSNQNLYNPNMCNSLLPNSMSQNMVPPPQTILNLLPPNLTNSVSLNQQQNPTNSFQFPNNNANIISNNNSNNNSHISTTSTSSNTAISPWGITAPPYPFNIAIPQFVPIPQPLNPTNNNNPQLQPTIPNAPPRAIRSGRPIAQDYKPKPPQQQIHTQKSYMSPCSVDLDRDELPQNTTTPSNIAAISTITSSTTTQFNQQQHKPKEPIGELCSINNNDDDLANKINHNISILRQSSDNNNNNKNSFIGTNKMNQNNNNKTCFNNSNNNSNYTGNNQNIQNNAITTTSTESNNLSVVNDKTNTNNSSVKEDVKEEEPDVNALYADVEEELDRTLNNQHNTNQYTAVHGNPPRYGTPRPYRYSNNPVRPSSTGNGDRFHLYNNATGSGTPRFLMNANNQYGGGHPPRFGFPPPPTRGMNFRGGRNNYNNNNQFRARFHYNSNHHYHH